jgi:hypothetical protein
MSDTSSEANQSTVVNTAAPAAVTQSTQALSPESTLVVSAAASTRGPFPPLAILQVDDGLNAVREYINLLLSKCELLTSRKESAAAEIEKCKVRWGLKPLMISA